MREGMDAPTLELPDHQDALVDAVVAANPRTIVVVESGGPVAMPWAEKVQGILEAWYPGIGGAQSLANILFGEVNPSARLAITFPQSDDQLPHPQVPGMNLLHPAGNPNPAHHHRMGELPALQRRLQRRRCPRRLQMVRVERPQAALPLRLRPLLHLVRLL